MGNIVLVVDDVELNRELLESILEAEYKIITAENGAKALEEIRNKGEEIEVILLDIQMPVKDGFEVMDEMQKMSLMDKIPILVVSAEHSVEIENKCFELGVADFIHKPFDPSLVKNRVKNIVELFRYKKSLEEKVDKQTAALRKQYRLLQLQAAKLKESNEKIIDILGNVVEYRNLESGEHIRRVKGFTKILANSLMKEYPEYGLTEKQIEIIVVASSLHDIGKIAIPDSILLKPARLTDDEFQYMKSHTTRGCDIIDRIEGIWDEEYRKVSYDICRHHHERYDGKGYPDGLSGEEIPVSAQIVSIADVYDALVCERVYKDAYSPEKAFHMIVSGECGVFSPKLLECFRKVRKEFEELAAKMQ